MKRIRDLLAPLLLLHGTTHAADASFGEPSRPAETVPLVALLANPERFAGKPVRVVGAFRAASQSNALCLHKEDLLNGPTRNCLWIAVNFGALRATREDLSVLNGNYVAVEGIFDKDNHGHTGQNSGAIVGIWRANLVRETPQQ